MSLSSGSTTSSESDDWSDILGSDWRLRNQVSPSITSEDLDDTSSDGVPSLHTVDSSDSESGTDLEDELDSDGYTWDYSSEDADDEGSEASSGSQEDDDVEQAHGPHRLRQWVQKEVEIMYTQCYE
jgi:hypothetical protein